MNDEKAFRDSEEIVPQLPDTEAAVKNDPPSDAPLTENPSLQTEPTEETDHAEELPTPENSDSEGTIDKSQPENHSFGLLKLIFEYLEMFTVAICAVMLLFMFVVRLCDVRGESMEKTLYQGEKLIVSDMFYTPKRGDIVIFHQTGNTFNEPIVKRIIATEGEWVKLDFEHRPQKITVSIYDKNQNLIKVLDESDYMYLDIKEPLTTAYFEGMIQVPEGCVFVMGDNRNHSADSRSRLIGFVDERRILGKVLFRILPFSKFGAVD